jgi:hypothetical protein
MRAMSLHATTDSTLHRSSFQDRWVLLSAALGILALVCGGTGQWLYDVRQAGHPHDIAGFVDRLSSVLYHTVQLFVLHGIHLGDHVPWLLHCGRWLAVATDVSLVGYGLTLIKAFRSEWLLSLARLRTGHVVICGMGQLGLRLAVELREQRIPVVGIELAELTDRLAAAKETGIAVVVGDACREADLGRAFVGRARQVIAVCDDEQTNVAIAAAVGKLVTQPKGRINPPELLECWIFIADARLRQTFQREAIFPYTGPHYRVNVRGLDLFELAVRQVLDRSPLDFERIQPADATSVHLIIFGFGPIGQHMALQAAKIGHFANFQKTKVTVVEREGSLRPHHFLEQYSKFAEICDFKLVDLKLGTISIDDVDPVPQLQSLTAGRAGDKELTTFALCWDTSSETASGERDMFQRLQTDDPINLRAVLGLAERIKEPLMRFLVFQTRKAGFGALFPAEGRGGAIGPRMHAFGTVEEICSLNTLMHEREDAIAKVLHQNYYDNQIKEGKLPGSKPALFPWEQLAERFKDSSRQAADHIPVKLRALGYRVVPLGNDQPRILHLEDADQVELLAKVEHERWRAEWLLKGYSYAASQRDDTARTHPLLVSWDKLDQYTREWDRQLVRAIPNALERAGSGIYHQIP